MKNFRLIIAGGGTGGHIYPGLAIASAVQAQDPDAIIEFVGTKRGLERKIVPQFGYRLHLLRLSGLKGMGVFHTLKALFLIPMSLIYSVYILLKFKPNCVLGVGGYASGPLVLMASFLRFKTAIWEINAAPGLTNRILSKFVDQVWVVFDEAASGLSGSSQKVGMPVRKEIEFLESESGEKFRILVFGGSQGARGINRCISDLILSKPSWFEKSKIRVQTGEKDFEEVSSRLYGIEGVEVFQYLDKIENDYKWADLVICRSGAGTIAELAAARKPALLIPFPFSADDHQLRNAQSLVKEGAAELIEQKELTPTRLSEFIQNAMNDRSKLIKMRENIAKRFHPGAAENMAKNLLEKIK